MGGGTFVGRVVSNRMQKTVVVAVNYVVWVPRYHVYEKRVGRHMAHDENQECVVGDVVKIVTASRKLSKHKSYRVAQILRRMPVLDPAAAAAQAQQRASQPPPSNVDVAKARLEAAEERLRAVRRLYEERARQQGQGQQAQLPGQPAQPQGQTGAKQKQVERHASIAASSQNPALLQYKRQSKCAGSSRTSTPGYTQSRNVVSLLASQMAPSLNTPPSPTRVPKTPKGPRAGSPVVGRGWRDISEQDDPRSKDEIIADLQAQLDAETRRNTMLESELKLTMAAARRAEAEHQKELATVEGDVKRMLGERRHLLSKLHTIEVVEDSVRELYVQMKDRIAEDGHPPPEQLVAEKEALKGEDILVVLGALHAQLKSLWAFKVEAEDDLKASRITHQAMASQQVVKLRAELRQLEAEVRRAHQETAAANIRAAMSEEAAAAIAEEARSVAQAMATQHQQLLGALKAASSEAEAARRAAAAAHEEGKKRDSLVLANRQLESARHFDRVAQDRELRRLQSEHEVQLAAMHRELNRVSDLMTQNAFMSEQLQRATHAIDQLKKSTQPSMVADLQHKVRALEAALATQERRNKEVAEQRMQAAQDAANAAKAAKRPGTAPSPGSMQARSLALMREVRAAARREAQERAAHQGIDPIYQTIANVGQMHKAAKAGLKEVKAELGAGVEGAAARLQQQQDAALQSGPSASSTSGTPGYSMIADSLSASRQPQRGPRLLGAAGTNLPVSGASKASGPGDPNSSHGLGSPVKSTYGKPQPKPGVPVWNTIPKAALGIPPSKD